MKTMIGLSSRSRLVIGFSLIILLLILVSVIASQSISALQAAQALLFKQELNNVIEMKDVRLHQNALRTNLLAIMLDHKNSNRKKLLLDDTNDRGKKIKSILQQLISRNQNNTERLSKLKRFESIEHDFQNMRDSQTIPLLNAGSIDEAKKLVLGIQTSRNTSMQVLSDELMELIEKKAQLAIEESQTMASHTMIWLRSVALLAILLSLVMAVWVISNLRKIATKINEGIHVLATSASEITASTTQVAAGSVETAAAINQTTSTIEEVKQTSDVSAQKAKHVADIAQETLVISQSGKKSMDELIIAMHCIQEQMESIAQGIIRLSEQSKDIGEIIATVNSLAEQSNLLAVNAAIEAAKAGEQGKGFAVVAQEVKSMALQSKQATAQVRTILTDIQNATNSAVIATEQGSKVVEDGVKRSNEASESILSLAASIDESAQAAVQIMSSAQQQLVGMDQVAAAMQNINQASMQNVASTKQAEVAAKDLHELGQKLKLVIEKYN